MSDPAEPEVQQPEPVQLSARCLRYPSLYDEESGVRFGLGPVRVTVEQAEVLARRPFMDRIVLGEFDEDGRVVNELSAKDWAKARRVETGQDADSDADVNAGGDENEAAGSGTAEQNKPDDATKVAPKKSRST